MINNQDVNHVLLTSQYFQEEYSVQLIEEVLLGMSIIKTPES